MTTPTLPAPAAPDSPGPASPAGRAPGPAPAPASRLRRTLRVLAVLGTLPYIALKVAWTAGSTIGIPEGSVLLDHPAMMAVVNGISVLADAVVVLLALLLTRPWGLRVRAWLLAFPVWAAIGLLAPIMVAYPAQVAVALLGGPGSASAGPPDEPFLDAWVFPVVYGGFIVQGLSLGILFVLYARDRWGHVWRGRLGELPTAVSGPVLRACAVAGAVLALAPAALHILWACGTARGLSPELTGAYDADRAVVDAVRAVFLLVAAVATPALVLRRPARRAVRTTMALAWVSSGATGCWGAYMSLVALLPLADPGKEPTDLMTATYAGEMITGFLLAGCLAVVLNRRSRTA
ncbi:hypothetical protein ACFY7C_14885 [Streptomyces sp. NPDC012769]|uniref:hypothetical protein n=1 Tax=Streptomyces sp. NPDC012769 TaxID=3364848 RepID=UPI0036D07BD9